MFAAERCTNELWNYKPAPARTTKMFIIFIVVNLVLFSPACAETNVEVSAQINPVTVGGILALQCQIWNMQDGYRVMIVRTLHEQVEHLTTGEVVLPSSVSSRVFLAIRTFPSGSKVYFLTMVDVNLGDQGDYMCTVSTTSRLGDMEVVARDFVTIQIKSFPSNGNPSCTSNTDDVMYEDESNLNLLCSAEYGVPIVELNWFRLGSNEPIVSTNVAINNQVLSRVEFTVRNTDHNAVFVCEMTSEGFLDYKRSCHIGPVEIISQSDNTASRPSLITSSPKKTHIDDNSNGKKGTLLENDCDNICEFSSYTIFYLIISTTGASFLCVIFFITMIVTCCKYHDKTNEIRQRNEYIPTPPIRVADPNYRSLQRCTDNELVYMTLEDPNNPEGKVILPKEVFDEFYNRTLSLRKTKT